MKLNLFRDFIISHITIPQLSEKIQGICKDVDGMCSPETLEILNYAVSNCLEKDEQYLEIGTWLGRTAICATLDNTSRAIVIDPLTFDNSSIVCPANIARYDHDKRIRLIVNMWQNVIRTESWPLIGIHFFDGDHGDLSTLTAFEAWLPFCSQECLLIADDICMDPVRRDIKLFRDKYKDNIVFEYETKFGMGQYIIGFKSK